MCLGVYWLYWEHTGRYWECTGTHLGHSIPRGEAVIPEPGEEAAGSGAPLVGSAPGVLPLPPPDWGRVGHQVTCRGGERGWGSLKHPPQTPKNEFFTPSSPTGGAAHEFLGHDAVLEVGVAGEEEPDPAAGPGGAEFFHLQDPQSINPSWGGSKFIWGGSQNPKNPPPGTCRPVM